MGRRRPGARAMSVGALSALLALVLVQAAPAPAGAAPPAASRPSTMIPAGQVLARVQLRYRGSDTVGLVAATAVPVDIAPSDGTVTTIEGVPNDLNGPLRRGSRVGSAVVRRGGRRLATVALVTQRAIVPATLGQRLRDFLSRPLTIVALGLLLGCSLLLATLRARATRRQPASDDGAQGTEAAR
jgi:hypothetical protein